MPATVRVTVTAHQPPADATLLQAGHLVYQGGVRVPPQYFGGSSFSYGGTAFERDPDTGTFLMVGHDYQQQVAEFTLPAPVVSRTLTDLPFATVLKGFSDVLEGRQTVWKVGDPPTQGQALQGVQTAAKIGGLLAYQGKLVASIFLYYDGNGTGHISHYVSGRDLDAVGDLQGPYVTNWGAGMTGGYMARVPKALQAELGGPVVTGQCCLPIIGRTSCGPALFAIDPAQFGRVNPLPVAPLVYYPLDHPLGPFDRASTLFNVTMQVGGVVIPEGSRSVLFFGRLGLGPYCYGEASDCGDVAETSKGPHMAPYACYVWAYDVSDLSAVRRGEKNGWDIKPYAVWPLLLPFASANAKIKGATYDAATGRIFLSTSQNWTPQGDSDRPLIHVFKVTP